ncbi:NAD-dependent epimerase/dehydratase family protein [Candidatus Latescibacterota bacterium]
MKKVLVCGASGFIGRNVAEKLAQNKNYEMTGTYLNSEKPDIDGVKMIRADLTNKTSVDEVVAGTDILIQAAATTSGSKDIVTKPYYHVTDNAVINSLIFRSAFDHKVSHVVFFSCTVMYQSSNTPIKETDLDMNHPLHQSYMGVGWTKLYCERMCEFYARIGETRYTVARHSNIYGPYDKYDLERSHVFGATITKVETASDGEKVIVWGEGTAARDLLYSSDLVRFVELALDNQKEKIALYNVGYGEAFSVKELVQKIISASGKQITIEHDLTKPNIETKVFLDTARVKNSIGWEPWVSLDEGIRKTIDWYRENINMVKL